MMNKKQVAFENKILLGLVGSTAHGTGVAGQEDRDEMGIFVEPKECVMGLRALDHYIHRTAPEGVRSGPDDIDLTLYSLRKFTRLATQGNPSILLLLWLPKYLEKSQPADMLLSIRDEFISKEAGERFFGYLVSQRMRLTGERSKTVARPELVERYGYDTKYAMHALRLGLQGYEMLDEGKISVPVREPDRSILLDVRNGRVSYDEAVQLILDAEHRLRQKISQCDLAVDRPKIDKFLVDAHEAYWGGRERSV